MTDINLDWMGDPGHPNVEVLQHNIVTDPLDEGRFDLAHARLVLQHLPERRTALRRMVAALKPGGWLLLEHFDNHLFGDHDVTSHDKLIGQPLTPAITADQAQTLAKVLGAVGRALTAHGVDHAAGSNDFNALFAEGLADVQAEGYLGIWSGGSSIASQIAALNRANIKQIRGEIAANGWATDVEIDAACTLLADPRCAMRSPGVMFSTRGRRALG